MKKLETLKSTKFSKFTENELELALKIVGEKPVATCVRNTEDYYDYATKGDGSTTDGAGVRWDFEYKPIPGTSTGYCLSPRAV